MRSASLATNKNMRPTRSTCYKDPPPARDHSSPRFPARNDGLMRSARAACNARDKLQDFESVHHSKLVDIVRCHGVIG
jgi:hypothetical protein